MPPEVPILDISKVNLRVRESEFEKMRDSGRLDGLSRLLITPLEEYGACLLINHGFPEKMVENLNSSVKTFYEHPEEEKMSFLKVEGSRHGWIDPKTEFFEGESKANDMSEGMHLCPKDSDVYPDKMSPALRRDVLDFFPVIDPLVMRLFDLISIGLDVQDKAYLRRVHEGQLENGGCIRMNWYRVGSADQARNAKKPRFQEHTDYGSLTLVFQTCSGGFQVRSRDGVAVPIHNADGAILLMVDNMMQRWTSDRLIAASHMVVVPDDPAERAKERQTIIFFVLPHEDTIVAPLDGSDKYPPEPAMKLYWNKYGPLNQF